MNKIIILFFYFAATNIHSAADSKPSAPHRHTDATPNTIQTSPLIGRSLIRSGRTVPETIPISCIYENGTSDFKIPTNFVECLSGKSLAALMQAHHKQGLPTPLIMLRTFTEPTAILAIIDLYSLLRTFGSVSIGSFENIETTKITIDNALANMLKTHHKRIAQHVDRFIIGLDNKVMNIAVITNKTEHALPHDTFSLLLQFVLLKNPFAIQYLANIFAHHLFFPQSTCRPSPGETLFWLERYRMEKPNDTKILELLKKTYELTGHEESAQEIDIELKKFYKS